MNTNVASPGPRPDHQPPLAVVLTGSFAPFSDLLTRDLRARGHRVTHVPSDHSDRVPSVYEVQHEQVELNRLRTAIAETDVTILLTGLGPLAATVDDAEALDVILHASRPGSTLIEISSFGVFGGQERLTIDEFTDPNPAPGFESMLAAESRTLASGDWLRAVVVRAGLVYGPGGGRIIEALIAVARETGRSRYVGNPTDIYPLIHQDDLFTLLTELVENPRGHGIFHAVSEIIEAEALARLVATAAGIDQVSVLPPEDLGHVEARGLTSPNAPGRINVHALNTRGVEIGWAPTGRALADELAGQPARADPA